MSCVEDLGKLTLKELLTLARERFGSDAARLKTRAEVLAALQGGSKNPVTPAPVAVERVESVAPLAVPPVREIITSDFFKRRS